MSAHYTVGNRRNEHLYWPSLLIASVYYTYYICVRVCACASLASGLLAQPISCYDCIPLRAGFIDNFFPIFHGKKKYSCLNLLGIGYQLIAGGRKRKKLEGNLSASASVMSIILFKTFE